MTFEQQFLFTCGVFRLFLDFSLKTRATSLLLPLSKQQQPTKQTPKHFHNNVISKALWVTTKSNRHDILVSYRVNIIFSIMLHKNNDYFVRIKCHQHPFNDKIFQISFVCYHQNYIIKKLVHFLTNSIGC